MPEPSFPHALIPPPSPFPTWQGDEQGPLVYLAWGDRDYSRFPLPIHSNPGWTYWVLLQGEAEVVTVTERISFQEGEGFFCGPDCPFGFPQRPGAHGRVLVWIWRHPPTSLVGTHPDQLQRVSFGEEQVNLLKDLHTQTRLEIFPSRVYF